MTFRNQLKKGLAGLEKYLNLPSFPINTDDLLFGEIRICTDKSNPILLVLLITDTDNLCRDLPVLPNHDIHRKQILAAATAFLRNAEDLVDRKLFSFVFIVNT